MISSKQGRIFEFIRGYVASNHEAPTIAEIRRQFQISSPASVHQILVRLEKQGLITRVPNVSRGVRLVNHPLNPS